MGSAGLLFNADLAKKKIPGMEHKLRPWLQDFSIGGMTPYGTQQVEDQIKASDEQESSGWMLWNPDSDYTVDALAQDDGPNN